MTEPGAGSDLRGIASTATWRGDHYALSGSKTFVTNGIAGRPGDRRRVSAGQRQRGYGLVRGGERHAGLQPRAQAREGGPQGAGHGRAVLRRGPGTAGERDRRAGRRPAQPDAQPPPGAPVDGGHRGGCGRARAVDHARLRQGAARLRAADRLVPGQPLHRSPTSPRRSRSGASTSIAASPSTRPAS